jgi:hypothetical protein
MEATVPILWAGEEREVPLWYAEALRLLIFRFPRCNCKACDFCKETAQLAEDWLEKYDHCPEETECSGWT